jgi:LysR family transcriptional regulator, glycine cleavage system transcriptional activator
MPHSARSLPPLDFLRGFEAAARHLSFTRAAEELFLTQSAVSRQIQALEEFVGLPLFERKHRSLELTEAGQSLLRTVAPMLEQLAEATRRLRETRTGHVLTVTTTISFASMWLVPRLSRFRKEHPRIDVRVSATTQLVDIEREGYDLAIRDCPEGNVPPGAILLVGEHLAPVCSSEYMKEAKAARKPLVNPADLRHHTLLYLHDPTGKWPWISWAGWFESMGVQGIEPAGSLTFGQYDQVMQAAMLGQGIALGRTGILGDALRSRKLIALFGRRQQLARAFYVILAEGARSRPEVVSFVDWIKREIDSDREEGDVPRKRKRRAAN